MGTDKQPPTTGQFLGVIVESLALLRPDWKLLVTILLVSLFGAFLTGVGDPIALKLMVDTLAEGDVRLFLIIAVGMVLINTTFRGVNYSAALWSQQLRNRLRKRLVASMLESFYRLPYEEVRRRDRGYYLARLYEEPSKVTKAVKLIVDLFSLVAILILAAGVCLYLSWRVSLIVTAIVPVLVYLARKYGSKIRKGSDRENEDEADLRAGLGRAIGSFKNVRLFNLKPAVARTLDGLMDRYIGSNYSRYRKAATFSTLSGILLSIAESVVMIVAGFQVLRGELSLGGLFGFVSAYWRVVSSFQSLTNLVPSLSSLGAELDRMRDLAESEQLEAAQSDRYDVSQWSVDQLSFSYGEAAVLKGLTLQGMTGQRVLVVGQNGSGKSTLAHLLSGFLEPKEGLSSLPGIGRTSALLNDGDFVPGPLRMSFSHVGESETEQAYFQRLARRFRLEEKLSQDPSSLSDGEKRKALVLMTLLKPADLYIFDEPLANVDEESKIALMEEIFERSRETGLLVIMRGDVTFHREFDEIVRIDAYQPTLAAASS